MIRIRLKKTYKIWWFITMPHEINNEFLWHASQQIKTWIINWMNNFPSFNDFWADVEFSFNDLDKLYNEFELFEEKLDEIIKIVPLPKKIWWWEWYNKQFVFFYEYWIEEAKKYLPYLTDNEIDDIVNHKNMVQELTDFTKQDMLLIISLIKKKILEAKEKWETLVFSGD